MPRLDVAPDYRLFGRLLREPERLQTLAPTEWKRVLDAAEHARLLGWLITHKAAPDNTWPEWLKDRHLTATSAVREYERSLNWELNRLHKAFADSGISWVLLKGAAYLAANLPPGRGRQVADIDVLVPEAELQRAESALKSHGWGFAALDPYDERFYREWMHELPPMVHRERGSIVDLHHSILPRTSRLRPSTNRLLERAVTIRPGFRALCPPHLVLHAAAHLFHDGEISGAIRDVVDLDGLLRWFGKDETFWADFTDEARVLGLTRPAYYALRYAHRLLKTSIPPTIVRTAADWAPPAPIQWAMDVLVERTLQGQAFGSEASALALYIRSHWLRMPPVLLGRHLFRKAFRSP
jgi:hypothetical protein